MEIAGKRVLVTGASSGIGAEISREMARRGARLILVARGQQKLEDLANELHAAGAEATVEVCDLTDDAELELLAERLLGGDGPPTCWSTTPAPEGGGRPGRPSRDMRKRPRGFRTWPPTS